MQHCNASVYVENSISENLWFTCAPKSFFGYKFHNCNCVFYKGADYTASAELLFIDNKFLVNLPPIVRR